MYTSNGQSVAILLCIALRYTLISNSMLVCSLVYLLLLMLIVSVLLLIRIHQVCLLNTSVERST